MSLETVTPIKQHRLGIVAAKNLDDSGFLEELLGENISVISHINTNGANQEVVNFARDHGIPCTIYPLIGRSLPWSNARILDNSDFVYIIGTTESKSAGQTVAECKLRKIKHRLIHFDSCAHWRDKVQAIGGVLAAFTAEDIEKSKAWIDQLKALT